jgi:hypothetical protein
MLALAPCAAAFTIEIGEIVGVRNVEFSATALDRAAVLQIVNHESTVVECELHFDSGPQDRVRRINIPPLSTKTVNQSIRPDTLKVRVSGSCQ